MTKLIDLPEGRSIRNPFIHCDAIHIGMPKCGSTYLQNVGFASHPDINLIWEPGLKYFFEFRDGVGNTFFNLDEFGERFSKYVTAKTSDSSGTKTVISFEGFCGPQVTNRNDRILAESLFKIFGPTDVIVILREQYSFINSIWSQYVKEGGELSLKQFLRSPHSPAKPESKSESIFLRVRYDQYLECLMQLFGKDRVHVFFFEDFVDRFKEFMAELYTCIGADPEFVPQNKMVWRGPNYFVAQAFRLLNKSATTKRNSGLLPYSFYLAYRRWFEKRVFPSQRLNPRLNSRVQRFVSPSVQEEIRRSNRRLAEMLNKDIAGMGYECSSKTSLKTN